MQKGRKQSPLDEGISSLQMPYTGKTNAASRRNRFSVENLLFEESVLGACHDTHQWTKVLGISYQSSISLITSTKQMWVFFPSALHHFLFGVWVATNYQIGQKRNPYNFLYLNITFSVGINRSRLILAMILHIYLLALVCICLALSWIGALTWCESKEIIRELMGSPWMSRGVG